MEAVGQLTGGVAHDFNNILTVITGTIEILAEAVPNEPQLAAIAKMIDEAASRGAELTQHLLAFARKQPLQPRETDINALVIDTAKLLRPTLGEQIEIESMLEDEAGCASSIPINSPPRILNLALNARDAMPGGGKLVLETGTSYLDENYASAHGDVRPGHYVPDRRQRHRKRHPGQHARQGVRSVLHVEGPGKGTGLGLSMVYGFVKQSAGHIKIYSEEGHGTTIKMYLPPGDGNATRRRCRGSDRGRPRDHPGRRGRHTGARLCAAQLEPRLRDAGRRQCGGSARIVEAGRPFDLLFTDVIMPGAMNGRQLADECVDAGPDSKVLFTSGYTENAIIHHGRLDSGVLLLAKPYRKAELARMIRNALGRLNDPQPGWSAAQSGTLHPQNEVATPPTSRCAVSTIRIRSAAFRAPSFFMMLAR